MYLFFFIYQTPEVSDCKWGMVFEANDSLQYEGNKAIQFSLGHQRFYKYDFTNN